MMADEALQRLATGAVVHDEGDRARVALVGPDTRAFLHRMSTNHVDALSAGQGRLNVFPTDKGRFVDVAHHLDRGDKGVLLVGSRGRGPALAQWFDRYIFSEKIELSDLSSTGSCALVAGAGAAALVDGDGLAPWDFRERDGERLVVRTFDRVDAAGKAWPAFLVVELARTDALSALASAGAHPIDDATDELLRIAAGVPVVEREIADAYNPLDLDLHDAIHWAKGCYIGQEVIARLDTYQKQTKHLVGLALDDPSRVAPGDPVHLDGTAIGTVTSVAPRSAGLVPSALAVVRLKEPEGVRVVVKHADTEVPATAKVTAAMQKPHP